MQCCQQMRSRVSFRSGTACGPQHQSVLFHSGLVVRFAELRGTFTVGVACRGLRELVACFGRGVRASVTVICASLAFVLSNNRLEPTR